MSVPNPSLPGIRQPLLDGALASRPFYLFWQWASVNLPAVAASVDDLTAKVDALSGGNGISPNAGIRGSYSIITQGTLAAGIVQIGLQGDVASPGFTQYYGSDTTGAKGWFNVSDALVSSGNISKTVDAEGVTSFDLTDVTDTGVGTLRAITVDTKGRIAGTRAATITGADGRITVAHGDASDGLPTIDLAEVADVGGGTLLRTVFDVYGRKTGTSAATTSDLAEGVNLYYTDARSDARITLQKGQPNGLATLDSGGKLDTGQLPALAITQTFVVASEAAMLALDCQQGDIAVRTDLSKSLILTAAPPSTLANWQDLLTPTSPVTSVFGRVGSVTAASGDYTFAQIADTPTTLSGYGITDAATSDQGSLADTALQPGDHIPAADVDGLGTAATTDAADYATAAQGAKADSAVQTVNGMAGPDVVIPSSGVPYLVADGDTYSVPLGIQALWTVPIELKGTADLDVSGYLVEVA